jgi:hypothetical protein
MKPTPADIAIAISQIQAGDWIDPAEEPAEWSCQLYNPAGKFAGDGDAHTPGIAMAMAWICCHDNDALCRGYVELDWVPSEVPDDWRFELQREAS